jgi:UDP-2-acetamido-2,6-beta-L-arabino-hexul-4-ose reductase
MSGSQVFFSSTEPGRSRGNHFHRRKVERFIVVGGVGVIRMRRLWDDDVVEIPVGGGQPMLVDMPTLWAHSIQNVGSTPLQTLFWTNDLFDPESSDTYAEPVLTAEAAE